MDSDARVGMVPLLPGYEWIRPLGSGGFADVFLCRQELPSREVAVKVARRDRGSDGEAGIAREADVMALVSGHPAVAQLYGAGRTPDGRPYLVMEYCPVANILDQVRQAPMSTDRAMSMVIRMCGGAEMLHRAGYVHRDIKPSNIMINAFGSPVLTDFGVAEPVGADPRGGRDGFSVMWAPPEQIAGTACAHPTQDVWALGATLWTLLMGRSPFEVEGGDNSAHAVAQRVARGRVSRIDHPGVPDAVTAIVRRAMSLDPEQRFGSAAALGYALQTVEREMHRPVTEMKLSVVASSSAPSSALSAPSAAALDAERTRTRRRSFADGPQASSNEAWAGNSTTNRTGLVEGQSKRPAWVVPVLALVMVLATAGLVVAMLTGGGHSIHLSGGGGGGSAPTPSSSAGTSSNSDQGDAGTVPPEAVTGLTATPNGNEIRWGWEVPQQGQYQPGALEFKYVLTRPGEAVVAETMRRNSLTTTAVSGENCLTVSLVVTSTGRESAPVTQCVTVP
ncbi:Serine/threonine-protein kinase PknK [uncultured Actinomyces sp.]|nr:Serine/threonine-protein kinase PknK [uncultured Actinomyces sp.]